MSATTDTEVTWTRPGPGSWQVDLHHCGPAPSRALRDLFTEAANLGMAEGLERLGAPVATMRVEFVHGRMYRRMVPVVAADRDGPPPPWWVLWVAARVHPTFRRLRRQAARALADRVWVDEHRRWETEWKPAIVAANAGFTAVDVSSSDDAALAAHIDALWQHLRWTTRLHFRLHASDMGPIGLLLAATDEWGLDRFEVMGALAGASPATNEPAARLGEVRAAVEAAVARGADVPTTVDEVRALSPEAAQLLEAYVADFGWRLTTGYDVVDRTLVELPDVLVRSVTAAVDAPVPGLETPRLVAAEGDRSAEVLRVSVPVEHRAEFDVLLADARAMYGMRDENGPLTYEWPAGVLRRALLEAADRLVPSGRLADADHVFDATVDEVVALLRGVEGGPSSAELADRYAVRMTWPAMTPPATLGPEDVPPPMKALPLEIRRLSEAVLVIVDLLDAHHAELDDGGGGGGERLPATWTGLGIGSAPYRGRARVITDVQDALTRVEPGDVLVTTYTVPTFNSVLAVAGAVITAEGGLLSHAAVMARELGLAAVIGAKDALTIPDGAEVEVDPVAGRVRLVEEVAPADLVVTP